MIVLENVSKIFTTKNNEVTAVDKVNIHVKKGEIHGVIGYSGAGKSTLIRCVNLLERPTNGKIYINGEEITSHPPHKLGSARRKIGMIFPRLQLAQDGNGIRQHCHPVKTYGDR